MESQMVHPHGRGHDQQDPYKARDPHLGVKNVNLRIILVSILDIIYLFKNFCVCVCVCVFSCGR